MKSQTAPVPRTAITVATVMHLLILLSVKTVVEAGWVPHALIRASLGSKFPWTADSASVGLDTQVSGYSFTLYLCQVNSIVLAKGIQGTHERYARVYKSTQLGYVKKSHGGQRIWQDRDVKVLKIFFLYKQRAIQTSHI